MKYILANGTQERWESDLPKQLIEINGERLIDRIRRQFPDAITVSHNSEITKGSNRLSIKKTESTIHTTISIKDYDEITIFLLGDVYYSNDLASKIKRATKTTVFGNSSEIFAVVLDDEGLEKQNLAFKKAIAECERGESKGKLWDWYKFYSGLNRKQKGREFVTVDDHSQDFDRMNDIWIFYDNLKKRNA